MELGFYLAYVLSAEKIIPRVVVGAHWADVQITSTETHKVVRYMSTDSSSRVHIIDGKTIKDDEQSLQIDMEGTVFKLELLTLDRWNELGEQGLIVGWDDIRDGFVTTGDIQQFYVTDFLMSFPWYISDSGHDTQVSK